MPWYRRWTRVVIWTIVAIVLLSFLGILFLTRTSTGIRMVLDQALPRVQSGIEGTITYESVASPDLLSGAELRGVEIRDADGRIFLRSDTLSLTYSVLRLLSGDVILNDVRAAGLTVSVERLPDQDRFNVLRIFQPRPPGADRPVPLPDSVRAPGPTVLLRDVEVARARIRVVFPVEDPSELAGGEFTTTTSQVLGGDDGAGVAGSAGGGASEADGDALLRVYSLDDLNAVLPRVSVLDPNRPGQQIQVESLSVLASVQNEPARIENLRGRVSIVDSRVTVDAAELRLSDTRATGRIRGDWSGEEMTFSGSLDVEEAQLADLQWLVPDLPDARVRGGVDFSIDARASEFQVDGGEARLGASLVRAEGGFRVAPEIGFSDLHLEMAPFEAPELDPWLTEPLPYRGRLEGEVTLDGTLSRLAVAGTVDLVEEGLGPTTVEVGGALLLGDRLGVDGLAIQADPVDFALVRSFWPDGGISGTGAVFVDVTGRLSEGLALDFELEHEDEGLALSRIQGEGTVRTEPIQATAAGPGAAGRSETTEVYLEIDGEVDPLDLGAIRTVAPDMELTGLIEGSVQLSGRLGDLQVRTEIEAPGGTLVASARFDARNPGAGYQIDGSLDQFQLSDLVGSLPSPTTVSGRVQAGGRGLEPEELDAEIEVELFGSRVDRFEVDSARASLRVTEGRLLVDTLEARTNLANFTARGELGILRENPRGEIRVGFVNDSLDSARSLLLGETPIAADTLSPLEREVLELDGVDPDTLPATSAMAMNGRLRGDVILRGWVDDFTGEGTATVEEFTYGSNYLRQVDLEFTASGLPGTDGTFQGRIVSDSLQWAGRTAAGASADFEYTRPGGRVELVIRRSDAEDYRAAASFEADSLGGAVELEELALRFGDIRWQLEGPSILGWSDEGLRIEDFALARPDADDPMRIVADGFLPREGEADFDLEVDRLRLDRLSALFQSEEPVGGVVDLDLRVTGRARSPLIAGTILVDSLSYRSILLTRVEGSVDYASRLIQGSVDAWRDDLRVARVDGRFPADLSFREVADRVPAEPMSVIATVADFPLAVVTSFVTALEMVQGTVDGQVELTGTPEQLETIGSFQVRGGAFSLPALGVRTTGIQGNIYLDEDEAEVDLIGRSGGTIAIRGPIGLSDPTDPTFDLVIQASQFRAVDRRDVQARLGGEVSLGGTFRSPVLSGRATVDEGALRIEEFARSAEVVDLSDPRFFDVVDTTLISVQPVIDESQNPFLQNLQMDIQLEVQRNTWLRSRAMNVEMGGDLSVNWNRTSGDMALTGTLNAIRGTYAQFGRQFQVSGGTVEFVGTPGIDPNLNIQADTRLRTEREPLTITATVTGTLARPRVNLSSNSQPPISEAELVSYLLFNRPSFALSQGENTVVQNALGTGSSIVLGAVANQLGSVAQQAGFDYFAVTQESGFGGGGSGSFGGVTSSFEFTQVELGQYLTEDIFISLVVRPIARDGTERPWGVRSEWRLDDLWTVEGFVEDRFTRGSSISFSAVEQNVAKIFGFFLYRDWGY